MYLLLLIDTVKFMDNNPELFGESGGSPTAAGGGNFAGPTSPSTGAAGPTSGAASPSAARSVGRTGPGGSVLSSAGRRMV
jgi:hypothetical protein